MHIYLIAMRTCRVLLVTGVLAAGVTTAAWSQGRRWSLAPLTPFPCGAVDVDGSNIIFRETIVIVCNGKEQLEMPACSILGTNAVCSGTTLILSHAVGGRASLFDAVRRCSRIRQRR